MRTVFEEEEEIAAPDPQQDRELTISSTTLLAIFFGLVLVCGLFFGLGYTLGRRVPSEASQLPSDAAPSSTSGSLQPSENQPKPSAASQPESAPTPAPADTETSDTSESAPLNSAPNSAPQDGQPGTSTSETSVKPALQPVKLQSSAYAPAQPAPALAVPAPQQAPAATQAGTPAAAIMVQIAAISNPADADVLVSALQKRGYSVTSRRVPGDSLIRVQVGPFSNRADAIAMRQKLLGDGYNAILK